MVPTIRPEGHAGVLILPVERIAHLAPPFAVLLVGRHPRLPAYLHVDRSWDFTVVSARCDRRCPVEYHRDEDAFECECTGARYRPSGRPLRRRARPLRSHPVKYREEILLMDLAR